VAVAASGRLIEAAIGLAAPVVVALLLADILLGVIGRAVPRVPIHFVGMPLKALLGLGTVLLGLGGMDLVLQGGFRGFLELLQVASRLGR
jgi:flagellar biosynthesis protein FliR